MHIKTKFFLKTCFYLFLVSILFSTSYFTCAAIQNEIKLNTDGKWVQSNVTHTDIKDRYFVVKLPSAGTLQIKAMSYTQISINLYNVDLSEQYYNKYNEVIVNGNNNDPQTKTFSATLEAGTYYIHVYNSVYDTGGEFKLSATFIPANNNEREPNDYDHAMPIMVNQNIKGLISWQDKIDWYKIALSVKTNIDISVISYLPITVKVFNSDLSVEYIEEYIYGKINTPTSKKITLQLNPGIYYVKLGDFSSMGYEGTYTIKWNRNTLSSDTTTRRATTPATTKRTVPNNSAPTTKTIQTDPFTTNASAIIQSEINHGNTIFIWNNYLTYMVIDNEIQIIGYIGTDKEVTIPEKIQDISVTSISEHAFGNQEIARITIPDSVTSIDKAAFEGTSSELILCGNEGFYAQQFAQANGLRFISITEITATVSESEETQSASQDNTEAQESTRPVKWIVLAVVCIITVGGIGLFVCLKRKKQTVA